MGTVSLEILKNYIQSQGGVVSSQQIVRHFQPFLKDPNNKGNFVIVKHLWLMLMGKDILIEKFNYTKKK